MGILGIVGSSASSGNELGTQGGGNWGRYDVKRKNQWKFTLDNTFASNDTFNHSFTIACYKANRPNFKVSDVKLNFGNESWFVAGKPTFDEELSLSFYDSLPDGNVIDYTMQKVNADANKHLNVGQVSAAQLLYNWWLLIYNPINGSMGLASEYKTNGFLTLYASVNSAIERWMYLGVWPNSITNGEVDWSSEGEALTVDATFRYDKVFRINPTMVTEPQSNDQQVSPEQSFFFT